MSGEIEAAGDLAMGGLLGRAFEPRAGGHRGEGGHAGAMCLNCGTALIGPHCHRCGQPAHIHRTIGAIWHEILHGVVHFEGKLWRTLPLLVWHPGQLTRRYVHGERARFVSPMAMFLFSIFTMFAVLQIMGISPPAEVTTAPAIQAGIEETRREIAQEREHQVKRLNAMAPGDPRRAGVEERIREIDANAARLASALPALKGPGTDDLSIHTGWHRLDKGIQKASRNPGLALYKLQANSYKFSWLLIPLSIPFVWLLFFWKREYRGYDHAVFVTYSIAFMSLLFIVLTIAGGLGVPAGWLWTAGLVVPAVHIYRQLRGAYRLRRWSAGLRTFVLLNFIVVILILFALILLTLGLVG